MFHCIIGALKWDQIEKFPNNNLESSKTGLQDNLESFQMAWKVSRWTGMFTDGLECQQIYMDLKVFRWPGKLPGFM